MSDDVSVVRRIHRDGVDFRSPRSRERGGVENAGRILRGAGKNKKQNCGELPHGHAEIPGAPSAVCLIQTGISHSAKKRDAIRYPLSFFDEHLDEGGKMQSKEPDLTRPHTRSFPRS